MTDIGAAWQATGGNDHRRKPRHRPYPAGPLLSDDPAHHLVIPADHPLVAAGAVAPGDDLALCTCGRVLVSDYMGTNGDRWRHAR